MEVHPASLMRPCERGPGTHIEAAHVIGVHHALAAVSSERLSRPVGVVLHRVLPVVGVPPQIYLFWHSETHSEPLTKSSRDSVTQ
jgi:hypothetical protein